MGFFKPAWQNKNPDKRLKAVKKLTDQNILFDIANNGNNMEERIMAVSNLTSQKYLADIIKNKKNIIWGTLGRNEPENISIPMTAAKKLTDQSLIKDILKNGIHHEIFKELVVKITDQALLADIAKTIKYPPVNLIDKITNQSLLLDISKTASIMETRLEAADKLSDRTLADEVYIRIIEDGNKSVYIAEKITDKAILRTIYPEYDNDKKEDYELNMIREKQKKEYIAILEKQKNCTHSYRSRDEDYACEICGYSTNFPDREGFGVK